MQCTDVFFLKADICQLGMDQRKVNMLAREYAHKIKAEHSPVIVSHPMLMGLKKGMQKMSKSDPDSAIFMEDSASEVARKIKHAFCPEKVLEDNPVINYTEHIIFPSLKGQPFLIKRDQKWGGDVTYANFEELKTAFQAGDLAPADLKSAVTERVNELLEPVRTHFETDPYAKKLLATIKRW